MDAVDLYWLPLGAGGWFVRLNGRVYEALAARLGGRASLDLYHSALEIRLGDNRWVVEQTPVPDLAGERRGVVARGPVGARWAGRLRVFRYEVRLWSGGSIPDVAEAVHSPQRVCEHESCTRRILESVRLVPTPVWGRDELGAGEMWNSNAVIAWILTRSGIDMSAVELPPHGRAPGWDAGVTVARRGGGRTGDPPP